MLVCHVWKKNCFYVLIYPEWLKPQQVLLGLTLSRPTIPISASTIPHVVLEATINCIIINTETPKYQRCDWKAVAPTKLDV